jgi:hypothetical protein
MNRDSEIQKFWGVWLEEEVKSSERLRRYTLAAASAAKAAGQAGDLDRLAHLFDLYIAGRTLFTDEPLLTTFEIGKYYICLVVADSSYLNGKTSQSFQLARLVLQGLLKTDNRRAKIGLNRLPNSELRVSALGIQAACFCEDRRVSTVEQMTTLVKDFWSVAETFWRNLELPTVRDEMRSAMRHLIAIWELDICKACLNLGTWYELESVKRFNDRHGHHLYPGLPCFREIHTTESLSAWFWDYEYAKLLLQEKYDPAELDYCAQRRLATARLTFGSQALVPLLAHWEGRHRRYQLIVLNFPANSQDQR